ncbi:hypothetical protein STEG23_022309, partial [Scotinomys teguina]
SDPDAPQLKNGQINAAHTQNEVLLSYKRNNDIMKFVGKWMQLENVILSEVTQTQKDKHGSSKDSFTPNQQEVILRTQKPCSHE